MSGKEISMKTMFFLLLAGEAVSMGAVFAAAFFLTGDGAVLLWGAVLTACALLWLLVLTVVFAKRLSRFTAFLCRILDDMIEGRETALPNYRDTQLDRIHHRLTRLYGILRESGRRVEKQRRELQGLISDISHQVKTPAGNLKMVTDTLLTKPVTEAEREVFLWDIRAQTDKLEFLMDALVKTSRLETGVVQLKKRDALLYDTLAQAMSGIVYAAEKKNIAVCVDCPETLRIPHDGKWTEEALFNILDNAVKYTPAGGGISVDVEKWEMSAQIRITDTGRGIPPERHADIFRRFYREEEVHDVPGVGIGLYLAREIISRQGGYITVAPGLGKGSVFTVTLPLG